ncbi:PKD-like domain-containing protein [uncultured Alistipes sp.]|uniref:PKD-like domain-containing protein n=1 Tax=uncultured Alistipes sp. TaxID=538949 RepID=UPI0026271932|nr:PKD-like domain-containing protein [uncultured Alistipes sp.]
MDNDTEMKRLLFCVFAACAVLASCNKDEEIGVPAARKPVITLDSETAVYKVKAGRDLTISPSYENADDAQYAWTIDGRVVGRGPSYTFRSETTGRVFVGLSVTTAAGSASEELRIDVVELEIPAVSLAGADEGFMVLAGKPLELKPLVAETSLPTTYSWRVDGTEVSAEKDYVFMQEQSGEYTLRFEARNEDGEDAVEFGVRVSTADEMPFSWTFDRTEYNLSSGRAIRLSPLDIESTLDALYTWTIDGEQVQQSSDPAFVFDRTEQGTYAVAVVMTNALMSVEQTLTVHVCPPEGRYYRAKTAASSADCDRVCEFLPAPGQFVNEGYTAATMEEACAVAEKLLAAGSYVSLGGFGGSIVVGFDHSIDNSGGDYDFAVEGNSFESSSEPGIVWVMQDENGDGLPNDTWYELKGSEWGKPETVQDYAVTYYKPASEGMDVQWTDNRGGTGTIDHLAFHEQAYYPAWVEAESYTLRGTRLEARNYDQSGDGTYWILPPYDWGYADNYSSVDRLTNRPNSTAAANANRFRISDAVRFDGQPANLRYVDFVKIQTGINAKCGWLGEASTEVLGVYDCRVSKR